jgi:competence protein ComEA
MAFMRFWFACLLACGFLVFAGDEAASLPNGPGKDVVAKVCTACHGVSNFRKERLSKDEWQDQVGDMVDRGAKATDDEVSAIVAYLTANFGPESKVNVNTAPIPELKTVLEFTTDEAVALIEYRQTKGDFKEWKDLEKVPGLDQKKIEEKKDLMAF